VSAQTEFPAKDTRLSNLRLLGFGAGSVGTAAFVVVPQLFLLYLSTELLGIPAFWAGILLFIPKIWEFLIDPYIGRVSDNLRGRWGRRKPFLVFGAFSFCLTFIILFSPVHSDDWLISFSLLLLAYLACTTAFSLFAVPYISIPADLTEAPNERTRIVAFRMTGSAIGILLAGGCAPLLVYHFGGDLAAYQKMAVVLSVALLICMLLPLISLPKDTPADRSDHHAGFFTQLANVRTNGPFLNLVLVFVLQVTAMSASIALLPYFVTYNLGRTEADISTIYIVLTLASLVSYPMWTNISNKLGKAPAYLCALLLCAFGFSAFYAAPLIEFWPAMLIVAVIGLANGGAQLIPFSLFPDLIQARSTSADQEGMYTGLWVSSEKLGLALGAAVAGIFLSFGGYIAGTGDQSQSTITVIWIGSTFGVALINLIAAFLVRSTPPKRSPKATHEVKSPQTSDI